MLSSETFLTLYESSFQFETLTAWYIHCQTQAVNLLLLKFGENKGIQLGYDAR